MAVVPARLEGVTSNEIEADQLKASLGISNSRPIDMAKHVRFAAARRARACAPQILEKEIRLSPVVPANGQLVADLLNVQGLNP